MARPLRIQFPGAAYHVMNRGNAGHVVFGRDDDYSLFVDKLGEFVESFQISLRSYCLMPNHFHLFLSTPNANLSRFMQTFMTSFTVTKNRRDRRSGHLFQGRFKSLLVEDEAYGSKVSQYIHLNPVRLKALEGSEINEILTRLRNYPWSSYKALAGLTACPKWLDAQAVLCRWGNKVSEQQLNYSVYVENGLMRTITDPFEAAAARSVLGTDRYVDEIRRGLSDMAENVKLCRAKSHGAQLLSWTNLEDIFDTVCIEFSVTRERILATRLRNNVERKVSLYLASKYCRGRYPLSKIADEFGISDVGLTSARYALVKLLEQDEGLAKKVRKVEKQLSLKHGK
jgi:putative transposase